MNTLMTPTDIEKSARAAGVTMRFVCAAAEIAPSTFTRWKSGTSEPTLAVYRRLHAVVAGLQRPDSLVAALKRPNAGAGV